MPKLLVIADDLTGACDTGVQFARKGIPTVVLTGITGEPVELSTGQQVVVVNTESRHLEAIEAGQRVKRVVELEMASGVTHFYKKTDSTMRGNIGSELEALMFASGQRILAFIPAFPKLGRTTREGCQYIDGKALHKTNFASDPLDPVAGSFIPAIIESQTRIQARIVSQTEMLTPASVRFDDAGIYVFDATTDDDLQLAGALLKDRDLLTATAGSSGFAEFLPILLDFARQKSNPVYEPGRMLAVSGSVNEVSLRQTANAEAQGFACVTLSAEMLLAEDTFQSVQSQQAIAQIVELDGQGREVILRSAEKPEDLELCLALGRKRGLDLRQIHHLIARNLGAITGRVLEQTGFRLLTVFGGDTLLAIARACGWSALLPQEEVLPGVVVSLVAGDVRAPLLITKAGGFGPEDVLVRMKEILRSRD
jgi:uncharacterized protein YgbK (DUF1537 family)